MWLTGRSSPADFAGLPLDIEIRPIRNARRMRLRFDEARGVLKLTCPTRTSRKAALRWVSEQRSWIDQQIAARAPLEPFEPGTTIPLEGAPVRLAWIEETSRIPVLAGGELRIGGPEEGFARRVETFLRQRALDTMTAEVAEFADRAAVTAGAVSIGDAATRWGSCSSTGRIRLNWRLIMASPDVRRFVVAHEVAHLVHMDHGAGFRALEALLVGPGLAEAKSKLRLESPRLRRLGRRG